jgi:amidase
MVADGQILLGDGWTVPVQPLIGCVAAAPARETVITPQQGAYLGNTDCCEIGAGATVILPVEVPGARLYFGDCKAAMGDGEVVCALEIEARIVARAEPIGRPESMGAPRVLTADRLITVVSGISLADACRAAFAELKMWLEDE